MPVVERERLSQFLAKLATVLDIPDYVYEDATVKYEDVGSWLAAEDSELKPYAPQIYTQGSFRLGTVVRPVSDRDEYDIDLVCHLELNKEQTTQKDLKQTVGDRLKKHIDLVKILQPMRRCWRLDYPPEGISPHFHMDVLPAIPNRERPPTGILITDTELIRWQKSNPNAYADWFYGRMAAIYKEKRSLLAKSLAAEVDEVPEWQVKTPLQYAIQILKRHRDVHFQTNLDNRPISIILTTLAALAYNNQTNIYDALLNIVQGMPSKIERRDGRWWVANPVDPEENFADKWNEHPKRREAFEQWLQKAQSDLSSITQQPTLEKISSLLAPTLGRQVLTKAATELGLKLSESLPASVTPVTQVPALGNAEHCRTPTWSMKPTYKAKVIGSVYPIKGGKNHWPLTDRSVPKRVWLKFTVTTNTPQPYEVHWQVVNTGTEAIGARGLRGDFYDSNDPGTNIRWESTLYFGTHWIEAFIIKDGVCVARSDPTLVRIRSY